MLHQRGVATAQRARAYQRPPRSTAAASLPLALQLDLAQHGSVQPPDTHSVPPRTYLLSRARRVESPHLAIPQRLLQQLFPACPTPPSSSASYSASAVAMRFEVDGTMQPKQSQVELRVYNRGRQKAARVWGHGAYDLLKSKLLVGWRREGQGGLVAVLCSCLLPSSYALGQAQPASNPPHADPGAPGSHQQQQQQQQEQEQEQEQQQRAHSDSAARTETPPWSLEAVSDCSNDLVVLLDDDTAGSPGQHGSSRCCAASSAHSLPQTSVETVRAGSPSSNHLAAAPSSLTPPAGAPPPPLPTTPAHHALAAHPLSRLPLSSSLPGQPTQPPQPSAPLPPLGSSTSLNQHLAAPIACQDAASHPASTAPASNRELSQSSSTRLPDPIPLPALPPHQQPLASTASLTAFYTAMPMLHASMGAAMQGSEPMQSPPGCPPSSPRTFVPSRLHPINQEVYVAWGFWRDLFDGTQRPFPKQGLPLLVRLTGAVITSPQPVLLVRRITPFGYYVLRGIKGLSRLKGKLLVRWSLLVSGEVEVEVRDPCPLGSRPGHPGCASALGTPTQWSAAGQQQPSMAQAGGAQAGGAPGGGWSSLVWDYQPTSCNSLAQDAAVKQTQGCSSSSSSEGRLGTSGLPHLSSSQTGHAGGARQGWLPVSAEVAKAQGGQVSSPASLAPPLPTPHSQPGLGPSYSADRLGSGQGSVGPVANNVLVAPEETRVRRHHA